MAWAASWVYHRWTHVYVDDARIAYQGVSYGGAMGALFVGIERRLQLARVRIALAPLAPLPRHVEHVALPVAHAGDEEEGDRRERRRRGGERAPVSGDGGGDPLLDRASLDD